MKNIVIYVHGKGGSAEEAEHYRKLFPEAEVIGFDYRATVPWEAKEEFPQFFAEQRKRCDNLTLVANSIGAFFSMSSLDEALIEQGLFDLSCDRHGKADRQYDDVGRRDRRRACRKERNSYRVRRNAVLELSHLCAGASGFVAYPHPHFVRRA